VDRLLGDGRSARGIALELGMSVYAVQRHAAKHLGRSIRAGNGQHPAEPSSADPLAELVSALRSRALTGDPQVAHQYRLSLLALDARQAVPPARTLTDEPEWHRLRERIVDALEPVPGALDALRRALGGS
jgi:hypothetical protein